MITKGIIRHKIVDSNKYYVEIPFLEQSSVNNNGITESVLEATLAHTPGIINSYNDGDVVFVSFEDSQSSKPVILGKLLLNNENRGYANFDALNISGSAVLPTNTKIGNFDFTDFYGTVESLNNNLIDIHEDESTESIFMPVYYAEKDIQYNSANLVNQNDVTYVSGEVSQYAKICGLKNFTFEKGKTYKISVKSSGDVADLNYSTMYINEYKFVKDSFGGNSSTGYFPRFKDGVSTIILTMLQDVVFGTSEETFIKGAYATTFNLSNLVITEITTEPSTKSIVYDDEFKYDVSTKTLMAPTIKTSFSKAYTSVDVNNKVDASTTLRDNATYQLVTIGSWGNIESHIIDTTFLVQNMSKYFKIGSTENSASITIKRTLTSTIDYKISVQDNNYNAGAYVCTIYYRRID